MVKMITFWYIELYANSFTLNMVVKKITVSKIVRFTLWIEVRIFTKKKLQASG